MKYCKLALIIQNSKMLESHNLLVPFVKGDGVTKFVTAKFVQPQVASFTVLRPRFLQFQYTRTTYMQQFCNVPSYTVLFHLYTVQYVYNLPLKSTRGHDLKLVGLRDVNDTPESECVFTIHIITSSKPLLKNIWVKNFQTR